MATKEKKATSTKKTKSKEITAEEIAATSGQQPTLAGNTGNAQVGDEAQPFGPGGDVDVANVDPGKGKGEVGPLILAGFWVRLGSHKSVPERFQGHLASVVESPWAAAPIGVPDQPIAGYTFDENKDFVVRTRDEANAVLTIPADAIAESSEMRATLHPFA